MNIEEYYVIFRETSDFVYIVDTTKDSVKNNAELIAQILLQNHPGKRIVYRTWDGQWCEILISVTGGSVGKVVNRIVPFEG